MTTFSDRLYQMGGVPVGLDPLSKIFSTKTKGRAWFVDPVQGTNKGGRAPDKAFTTMAGAFAVAKSGDIIYLIGKVTEQLVTPVNVFDVTVVGCGNRPRHADATPATGNYAAAQWGPPASGAVSGQATVRVIQQGWRFVNILFTMESATAAGVEIVRNAGSGDDERDGSHCEIIGCRFAGAGIGIRLTATSFTENPFNVLIQGNTFNGCTTAISAVAAQPNMVQILDNYFTSNTSTITAKLQASIIARNIINIFTASGSSGGIDLRSGGGNNLVTGNWLGGAYSNAGGYNGESGDKWWGNFADVSGGVTQADPA
jgi:hypothetical protein